MRKQYLCVGAMWVLIHDCRTEEDVASQVVPGHFGVWNDVQL